ncbi:hypothetical protein L2E82_16796 [Cichorium intybus]|uniref:Uncharacterized protein n=1 Tax=Cichorium intybus TaxID=13427 RepID=A0ACB9F748_CICIN|nr:hypothetical protein L2E82_16796 [Cichorium intybus]
MKRMSLHRISVGETTTKFGLRPTGAEGRMKNIMPTGSVPLQLDLTCQLCAQKLKLVADVLKILRNSSNVQSATKMEKSCVLKHRRKLLDRH